MAGGPYVISAVLTDPDNELANYTVVTHYGNLTVAKTALTITADNESKAYGQTLTFAGMEFMTSGLLNGDTVASVTLVSPGAPATALPTTTGTWYSINPMLRQARG